MARSIDKMAEILKRVEWIKTRREDSSFTPLFIDLRDSNQVSLEDVRAIKSGGDSSYVS